MKHPTHQKSLAHRGADHRRLVARGIAVSVAVHAALLAWVTFPPVQPRSSSDASEVRAPSDALQLVTIPVPSADVDPLESAASAAASGEASNGGSDARGEAAAAPSAADAPTATTASTPEVDRPFDRVTPIRVAASLTRPEYTAGALGASLGAIHAIEPPDAPHATGHEGHLHTLAEEEGPGFWTRLAQGLQVSVSGGGHCPQDIDLLGEARDRGFVIPQARGGGLNLPRAGGFSIPQSRGLGVRLPGGIGR